MRRSCSCPAARTRRHAARRLSTDAPGVGERDVHDRLLERERSAQFVRRVGDELFLCLERALQPPQYVVEGVRHGFEFVLGTRHRQPLSEVVRGDPPGGRGHRAQRREDASCHEPAQGHGGEGHHGERDARLDEQLVQLIGAQGLGVHRERRRIGGLSLAPGQPGGHGQPPTAVDGAVRDASR